MLEFSVFVWLEGGRGVLLLCLHLVLVLFFNEYVGCVLKSVFSFFVILVNVWLLCDVCFIEDFCLYLLCWLWARPVGRALFIGFVIFFGWLLF